MLEVSWCCVGRGKDDEEFVEKSLHRLSILLRRPPVEVELVVRKLSNESQSIVEQWSIEPNIPKEPPIFGEAFEFLQKISDKWRTLLIYCWPDSPLAKQIKEAAPTALWGCSNSSISVVYKRANKFILWHEALHLFGVDDCYDYSRPDSGTTCELSHCLMQYAPSSQTVGKGPFLCKKTIKKLSHWDKRRDNGPTQARSAQQVRHK